MTAPKSGAEIIPFLKTYVNLPGAIGFTVLSSELSNRFSRETVFTGIVATSKARPVWGPSEARLRPVSALARRVRPVWPARARVAGQGRPRAEQASTRLIRRGRPRLRAA